MNNLKKTLKEVQDYFSERGCELLENQYINAHTKMKYRCLCGNESSINFNNFRMGKRCGCGRQGLHKLTEEELKTEVEARGCRYVSSVYNGNTYVITCICKCGKIRECELKNIKKSKGCEDCRNKSFSIDYNIVKQYFIDHGCELLSSEYLNIYSPLEFRCSCGKKSIIDFLRFRTVGKCLECKPKKNIENLSGSKHCNWNPDREEVKYNSLFRRKCKAVLWNVLKAIKKTKTSKTELLLGYTTKQLKEHVQTHQNWEVVKNEIWHLDHIFPIKAFLDYGITDMKLINSLENLQPIFGHENLSKCDKYDETEFETWLKSKNIFYKKGDNKL